MNASILYNVDPLCNAIRCQTEIEGRLRCQKHAKKRDGNGQILGKKEKKKKREKILGKKRKKILGKA